MKTGDEDYPLECREAVRMAAFEFAGSGVFSSWEAVEQALCSRFDAESVRHIFASPFCRLDLEQRCQAARAAGRCGQQASLAAMGIDGASRDPGHQPRAPVASPEARRRGHGTPPKRLAAHPPELCGDIAALLADGRERTAGQIRLQLGAATRDVQRALRAMLASGEVHVTNHAPRPGGGKAPRVFAGGPAERTGDGMSGRAPGFWPQVDPDFVCVMDALARHE